MILSVCIECNVFVLPNYTFLIKYNFSNQYLEFCFDTFDKQVLVICNKMLFDVFVLVSVCMYRMK